MPVEARHPVSPERGFRDGLHINGDRVFAHQVANPPDILTDRQIIHSIVVISAKVACIPCSCDPSTYGVVEFDELGHTLPIEENPARPRTRYAAPELHFYNNHVADIARDLRPSARGELQITDLNRIYLEAGCLYFPARDPSSPWTTPDPISEMSTIKGEVPLRGIPCSSAPSGQAKYVTFVSGAVRDVVVDIRTGSTTFGKWKAVRLDDKAHRSATRAMAWP
ncbi:dTDP-4-dehydrorhamnose 3,5-epimerase family protein [Streptomyces sp. NPDC005571]|uniref:dTDP-4-dehydrorhamnose 3,5-epimerase family protein n=1 Tax=Streptomyces sp. NPDC005571 TaxID=3156888 RepID=UPI0033AACDF2